MDDVALLRGVYDTARAAALSGVPKTTLHFWTRTGLIEPSISREPRLWSWLDLLALRAIAWLRSGESTSGHPVSLQRIRRELAAMYAQGLRQGELHSSVRVSRSGELYFEKDDRVVRADGQLATGELLDLVKPYASGPDLLKPRPALRIIPGKLGGEPHVVNTRITTSTLNALARSGYTFEQILGMYRGLTEDELADALDLEAGLAA